MSAHAGHKTDLHMEHGTHGSHGRGKNDPVTARSLNRTGWSATLHWLTGCAIGEVLGMVIGTGLGWGNDATIALVVVFAFLFGYVLTLRPLLRKMSFGSAAKLPFAADPASINHHGSRR